MNILGRISDLMEERGWTTYRLGKESGVAVSTINNMFKRNTAPTFPILELLCKAFNITMAQFFIGIEGEELLTPEQIELLSKWDRLSAEQKRALIALMDTM